MSEIEKLGVGLTANLAQFKRDLDAGSRLVDDWAKGLESRSLAIRGPSAASGGSSSPGEASDIGGQIEAGLASAAGPITAFLNRFNSDFNKVGATVIELAKRIDGEFKFPRTQANFDKLRQVVTTNMVDSAGEVTRFGRALDRMLEGGKKVHAFADQFASMGSVVRSSISGVRPERISFANPIRSLGGLSTAANQAGTAFKSLGVQIAVSLGAFGLVYKGVEFLKDGVAGAANLNETLSKTDAILGDASTGVKKFADEMASKFGLVKQETLDVASAIGGLGKGLGGFSGKGLEDFTVKFTKLAADLSSFANTGMAEAGRALAIGLSGEQSDTLKRLGVVLTEDTVKAYAFGNGIAKFGSELTNQQKVMARAGLITKALADANGDLERTADSAANQYRKFTGGIENLGVSFGQQLLPYLNQVVKGLNSFVSEMAAADGGGNQLKGTLDGLVEAVASIASAGQAVGSGFAYLQGSITGWTGSAIEGVTNLNTALLGIVPGTQALRDELQATFGDMGRDMQRQAKVMGEEALKAEQKLGDIGEKIRNQFAGIKPATGSGGAGAAGSTPTDDGIMRAAKSVDDLNKKLREQVAVFGMTSRMAELYKLQLNGATDAQLADSIALSRQLDLMDEGKKKFDEMKSFAEGVVEAIKSPLRKGLDEIARISDAMSAGLLTRAEAARAGAKALQDSGIGGAPKFAAAVESNSVEGRSALLRATNTRSFDGIRDVARGIQELIALNREANNQRARVAANAGDGAIAFPLR